MPDDFTPCPAVNKAGLRCYLSASHPAGIHQVHPSQSGKSREAGASPDWPDQIPGMPPACHFCGAPVGEDREHRWYSTWPGDENPWTCPSRPTGHWPGSS